MTTRPLDGTRVVEMAGIGPVSFCGMALERLGASVVIIDRPDNRSGRSTPRADLMRCGRPSLEIDLKSSEHRDGFMEVLASSDVLIEGMRPEVMERLGLGPDVCHEANPRLVYGRISGWGPQGELSGTAGHDINYLGASGALWLMGEATRPPQPPLNLVGDNGGAMFLVAEILAALLERERTGRGRTVATSIFEGASLLTSMFYGRALYRPTPPQRGTDTLDGSAPHYRAYETSDGTFVAVGAVEDIFFDRVLEGLGIDKGAFGDRRDVSRWADQGVLLAEVFSTRTRAEWVERFQGVDCCVSPVLDPLEALDFLAIHAEDVYAGSLFANEAPDGPRGTGAPQRGAFTLESLAEEWSN